MIPWRIIAHDLRCIAHLVTFSFGSRFIFRYSSRSLLLLYICYSWCCLCMCVGDTLVQPMEKCNFGNVRNHSKHQKNEAKCSIFQSFRFFGLHRIFSILQINVFRSQEYLVITYFRSHTKWFFFLESWERVAHFLRIN